MRRWTLAHARARSLSLSHDTRYTTARTGAETRKTGCAWLKKAIGVYSAFSVMFQFEIEGVEWDKVVSLSVVVCCFLFRYRWLFVLLFACCLDRFCVCFHVIAHTPRVGVLVFVNTCKRRLLRVMADTSRIHVLERVACVIVGSNKRCAVNTYARANYEP